MAKATSEFKPITFEREIDGKKVTRVANNPSDVVTLRFDGWRQVKDAKSTSDTSSATASKTAASKS